jgi:proline iminopeptidase
MSRDHATSARPPELYPPAEPYDCGYLEVGGGHSIYWETCGNPGGLPALFLHGGPGGGCSGDNRRLFDPQRYRIILFDQRACGRSRPLSSLEDNTTALLVADIEALRRRLDVDRWLVLGGSWGATLALAYAEAFPGRVSALILRGVFTARAVELRWLYREGASFLFPDAWEAFAGFIPPAERGDLVRAYHARLTCGDPARELEAARAWCAWEHEVMTLLPQGAAPSRDDAALRALARIETHYFVNDAFLSEGQLLGQASLLQGIPGIIVQGRYDAVTPARTAWELQRAWPQARLQIIPDAGHASSEPSIQRALVAASDGFAVQWLSSGGGPSGRHGA